MRITQTCNRGTTGYIKSCLPKAIKLAKKHKYIIIDNIKHINPKWPFEDRILVWLLPNMENEVNNYHNDKGLEMVKLFQSGQILSLDEDLEIHLKKNIDTINRCLTTG